MGVEDDGNFLGSEWDPLLVVNQGVDFNGSVGLSSYNVGLGVSLGVSSSSRTEQMPKPSYLGAGSFSDVVSSFALSTASCIASVQCLPDFPSTDERGIEKTLKVKKRKSSPVETIENNEVEQQKDASPEAIKSLREKDEKKQKKTELNPGGNSQKQTAKNSKEHSQHDDSTKEDYIHIRAKRGQATNSHSLAERVRREKISERMKLLQDLVPGCNKITGKAVMLDEIINYVQSLQRQVEFLSMKLAAVNPELNFDIEQMLSKDVLHSREGSSAVLRLSPGMSNPHPRFHGSAPQGMIQPEMLMSRIPNLGDVLRVPTPQMSSMAQMPTLWGRELQNFIPMDFIPNAHLDTKELTGSMKVEL